jgi:hypothetical protein
MLSSTVTQTAAGSTAPVPMNQYVTPFNVALSAIVTGTVNYTVQYTFDNVFESNYVPSSGNWTNHPSLTSQTTTLSSNIAYPVTAIRLTVNSGTGTVALTIIEAGLSA